MANNVSGISSYTTQTTDNAPVNMAQCVREVYALMLSSQRDWAHTIQELRQLEERRVDEQTNGKVQNLQETLSHKMRVVSMVLGAVSICGTLCPEGLKHSYEWLIEKVPSLPTERFREMFAKDKTDGLKELSKLFSQNVNIGRDMLKLGVDIREADGKAFQAEIDAQIDKSKKTEEQRRQEARDRQNGSEELQKLLQQIDNHTAEGIRAMAR
jgi:hypothetical protein